MAKCVKPGRLFLSRILSTLCKLQRNSHHIYLSSEYKQDIKWWYHYSMEFNGVSVIKDPVWLPADAVFTTDACLQGCGGHSGQECFSYTFPSAILQTKVSITDLEFLAVVIAAKVWAHRCVGLKVTVACDNESVVSVINSGRSKMPFLQACARELLYIAARNDFEIRAVHIAGKLNFLSDLLSRFPLDESYRIKFEEATRGAFQMLEISDDLVKFSHDW